LGGISRPGTHLSFSHASQNYLLATDSLLGRLFFCYLVSVFQQTRTRALALGVPGAGNRLKKRSRLIRALLKDSTGFATFDNAPTSKLRRGFSVAHRMEVRVKKDDGRPLFQAVLVRNLLRAGRKGESEALKDLDRKLEWMTFFGIGTRYYLFV